MDRATKETTMKGNQKSKTACAHCGDKSAHLVGRDCGTWGRPVYLCAECKATHPELIPAAL
jgi:hypothetical protein